MIHGRLTNATSIQKRLPGDSLQKKQKNTFENLHKLAQTADMESFLSKLAGLWSTVL